jgi:hypothetical protein
MFLAYCYWVIDKDISVKISSTRVKSVIYPIDIIIDTEQSGIVPRWLPTVTTSTKIDPSQSKPLLKLPNSIEQESLRCDTSVLIDLAAYLGFESQQSLNQNSLVGKCIRGPKIGVHNVYG